MCSRTAGRRVGSGVQTTATAAECSARALTMIAASSLGTRAWRVRPPPLGSSWRTSSPGSNGILDHYAAIRSQPSICRPHRSHTWLQPHRVPGRTLVANAGLAGPCRARSSGTCAPVADPARRTSFPAHVCPLGLANCSALRSPTLQVLSPPAFSACAQQTTRSCRCSCHNIATSRWRYLRSGLFLSY